MADSEFSQAPQSTQAERLVQLRRDKGMTAEQLAQAMTAASMTRCHWCRAPN